jgi:quercetin dioxygenase-like cupin family protein
MSHRILDASTIDGRRKLVASMLEARAIRMNQFDNEPGQAGKEHDERETDQEEIYTALRGAGVIVVEGVEVALAPGRYVLVEPESLRQVIAGPNGLSYLIVGAKR